MHRQWEKVYTGGLDLKNTASLEYFGWLGEVIGSDAKKRNIIIKIND